MKRVNILLITNAPFLSAGNQSIKRTILGLKERNFDLEVYWFGTKKLDNIDDVKDVKFAFFDISNIFFKIKKLLFRPLQFLNSKNLKKQDQCKFLSPSETVDLINDYNQWLIHMPLLIYFIIKLMCYLIKNYKFIKNHVDIIWGYERMGAILGYIASKILKKPLITSFQGTALTSFIEKYGIFGTFIRVPFDFLATKVRANLILMTNDGTKGNIALELLGHSNSKILFLPNGVENKILDETPSISKAEFNLEMNEIIAVVSTRLDKWKRVDRAIYLLSALYSLGYKDISLIIIGDGEQRKCLEELVFYQNIARKVIFTGWMPYRESLKYLKVADMVWSFCDHTNLTNTVQDALAMGKIVVTLDDGSLNDYIGNKDYPLVLIPKDNFLKEGVEMVGDILKNRNFFVEKSSSSYTPFTWEERINIIANRIYALLGDKIK